MAQNTNDKREQWEWIKANEPKLAELLLYWQSVGAKVTLELKRYDNRR